jgi:DNA-binding transcriptional LysR family regulator
LEEELGVQLFDRLGKRVQLNETGTLLLQFANKILDPVDEANPEVRVENEPAGSLPRCGSIRVGDYERSRRRNEQMIEIEARSGMLLLFLFPMK